MSHQAPGNSPTSTPGPADESPPSGRELLRGVRAKAAHTVDGGPDRVALYQRYRMWWEDWRKTPAGQEALSKVAVMNVGTEVTLKGMSYVVTDFLGEGIEGCVYVVEGQRGETFALKAFHRPRELRAHLHAYNRLKDTGVPMSEILECDRKRGFLLMEFTPAIPLWFVTYQCASILSPEHHAAISESTKKFMEIYPEVGPLHVMIARDSGALFVNDPS